MRLGCGSDVVRMWLGHGSDVAWMWLGCGSDVVGRVFGCGRQSLAEVKGKRFPASQQNHQKITEIIGEESLNYFLGRGKIIAFPRFQDRLAFSGF